MSSDIEEDFSMQVDDSEDELDWEEVIVPQQQQHLEITLDFQPKPKDSPKKKGIPHAERLQRIDCHKIHTISLIANARARNNWINNSLLHARLLSLTPLHLQNAFGAIHKSRVPDQGQRGRMFERAVGNLVTWWAHTFFEVIPEGHIRNHTYDEIQKKLEIRGLHIVDKDNPDGVAMELETMQDIIDDDLETIRSSKSLMKHALMQNGTRDTSAQLFTALCRGLGIPARLVVSLQSVPWRTGVGKPKPKFQRKPKGKGKQVIADEDGDQSSNPGSAADAVGSEFANGRRLDGGPELPMSSKAKGKQKAKPVIKLRKAKDKGNVLGAGTSTLASPDPLTTPPVFWTEVFSRPDSKWFPVDPIRAIVNKRKIFDPSITSNATSGPKTKVENRMVYVISFEEDGYARDVTRRYAREYSAKVAKMQGGSSAPNVGGGGKGRQVWWDKVVNAIHRPYRLHRDDLEDQELEAAQMMEGMPTAMSGFKDHPLYVLERHLKQTETIHPPPPITTELGKFRGEPVYPRSSVVSLKTAENWMRSTGRSVKEGEQPMKMVKVRAGTVNRMRELEVLKDELRVAGQDGSNADGDNGAGGSSSAGTEIMQGLYAYSQTEAYIPEPVVDGIVPKNNFGNIDLYVPSMLPKGGVHVPFKGVAKIARKLGFDFAEAVTGFEFKKRRAFPIVEGVVLAAENEAVLLEAFWEAEREADEKARIKKEDRVLKQWTRLIHGLRIRQRLQEQYGKKRDQVVDREVGLTELTSIQEDDPAEPAEAAGGFLAGADRVVQAFHLPKNTHVVLPVTSELPQLRVPKADKLSDDGEESDVREEPELRTYDLEEAEDSMDVDVDLDEGVENVIAVREEFVPKTLQQMAEDAAKQQEEQKRQHVVAGGSNTYEVIMTPASVSASGSVPPPKHTRATRLAPMKTLSMPINGGKNTPARKGKARATAKSQPATRKSTRKRKRSAKDEDEDDKDLDVEEISDDAEEEKEEEDFSPSKRARGGRGVKPKPKPKATPVAAPHPTTVAITSTSTSAPAATPSSTRTLRPRNSKSTAKIEQEKQAEEAYRRAVAR